MKPVRSVERAIAILFLVVQSDRPMGLSEISRTIGLDKATSLRLLSTLASAKLVQQDAITRRYMPGANISRLYSSWRSDLRHISRPHLEPLLRQVQESVCLVCPRGTERVTIEAIAASHELCVVPAIGSAVPIYAGASGQVLMAYLPESERERIIKATNLHPVVPGSGSDRKSYLAKLEKVRNQGFAYSIGDVTPGGSAISAPVFDSDANIVATVVVRGPQTRLMEKELIAMAPHVIKTASDISQELGYGHLQKAAMS
ncbi:MAG: IclR family transcriptional regulator [Rhodospirillales bacterium]|jgi:DNA-binding IclR family transcriptional regulator